MTFRKPKSLTKSWHVRKNAGCALLILMSAGIDAADITAETRRCVKAAASTDALLQCERQARRGWRSELERHEQSLQSLLDGQYQTAYATAQAAWERFRHAEFALIDQTLGSRPDALAAPLAEGAKVELLRARAAQLATHLRAIQDAKTE